MTASWDGDVEYFSLWYYHGCLKYWLRVLKPVDIIGMHVGTSRLNTSFIYSLWCNSMGEKVNKTWFKDKFTLTTVIWHKAQIIVLKKLFSSKTRSLFLLEPFYLSKKKKAQRKWEWHRLLILLNSSERICNYNPWATRK